MHTDIYMCIICHMHISMIFQGRSGHRGILRFGASLDRSHPEPIDTGHVLLLAASTVDLMLFTLW